MLAYHYLKEDMTAGHGNEPPWKVGEKRSVKEPLVICEHGYHSSPTPVDGLKYLPGPMLCLDEIGKPQKQTPGHEDKFVSRSRQLLKVVDMSVPLRLLMCDIADRENARYEKETGKEVPQEALDSVLAGRKFAAGEIAAEEMQKANSALRASAASYSSSSYYSIYSSYYSYSSSSSYYYYSSYYSYSSSSSVYPELFAAYNKLALEMLEEA